MQAVLIATGEPKNLQSITECVPSPMIPVLNRPIMLYNLELLGRLGIKRILVSVDLLASKIESYFGDGQRWGLSLEYALQREPVGSAGVLRLAKFSLQEMFVVMPADTVADLNLIYAIQQHQVRQAQATVIVQPGCRRAGRGLHIHKAGRVLAVDPKNLKNKSNWTDTGIYLFDPSVIDLIPPRHHFEIHQHLLPELLSNDIAVWAAEIPGYWNPLETLQDYFQAQSAFLSKASQAQVRPDTKAAYQYINFDAQPIAHGTWAGRNTRIHPTVKIVPPVYIGQHSWIGPDVELGPVAVVGSNVVIDEGATIHHSIIFDNTYIGRLLNLENRLVDQDYLVNLRTSESIRVTSHHLLGAVHSQSAVRDLFHHLRDCFLAGLLLILSLLPGLVLSIVLFSSTGRIFTYIPCQSPRSFRWKKSQKKEDSYYLFHFQTRKSNGSPFRIGSWVERWEGERLPELLNVIRGELALVGVKPVLIEAGCSDHLLDHLQQTKAPGGVTGLWYVQNDRSGTFEENIVADSFYLATRSWRTDWKILWGTPIAWYRRTWGTMERPDRDEEGVVNGSNKQVGR